MTYPLMFGPPTLNAPTVHEYLVPVTIGSTASAATWIGYGVVITRPTSTTMKFQFSDLYAYTLGFEYGRQPASAASVTGWIITTDNLSVDGSITLTSVASGSATAAATGDKFLFAFRMSSDAQLAAYTGTAT